MQKIVILAEKPSQAIKFSEVFVRKSGKTDGYIECLPHRLFPNRSIIITWMIGHLTELEDPEYYNPNYKKWSMDTLPIIPEKPALRVKKETAKQFGIVKRLMNDPNCELIINGADPAREGEVLATNTYRLAGCNKPVKRLWSSSLEKSELEKAFGNLLPEKEKYPLYLAGASRQFADWLVGINATRAYSLVIQSSGTAKHLGNSVFSVGRVQTPTLAIVVKREREIQNFKSTPYHELWATFKTNAGQYRGIYVKAPDNRFSQKHEAVAQESIVKGKPSIIQNIKREQKEYKPPQFFSLNELQMEANKRFKWTPDQTLKTAQKLYDEGYLTYPRTDSRYITEAEADTIPPVLDKIKTMFPHYQSFIPQPLPDLKSNKRYVDKTKVTDHYAILPTKKTPDLQSITENEKKLYDLVVRSVIVANMQPAIMEYTEFLTSVGGKSDFLTKGKIVMKETWREIWFDNNHKNDDDDEDKEDDEQEGILPPVQEGMPGMVIKTEIKDKKTKSPKRYTAGNMIQVMKTAGLTDLTDEELIKTMKEVEGLGTVATRAAIIKELEAREYIKISRNKVYATEKGIYLISILEQANSILAKPDLTAQWESALTKISKQQYDANAFIKQVKMLTSKTVQDAKGVSVSELTTIQSDTAVQSAVKTGPVSVGECPSCKQPVMEREKFYGCSNFKECDFKIPKTILGKNITKTHMKSLLTKGQTSIIKGFTGKNGEFDAAFRYNSQTKKLDWIRG